ncbi:MAG: tripartite tricarboxylate transporter TctB family protein [Vicinamibacterales bacterium]
MLGLRSGSDVAPVARGRGSVFPTLVGAGLAIVATALIVERRRRRVTEPDRPRDAGNPRGVAWVALGAIVSLVLLERAGFLISSTLLFCLTARGFGSLRWGRNLGIGLAFALGVYLLFTRGLSLALPVGLLQGVL